jgi:type VI secretion system secreted protein Hcp
MAQTDYFLKIEGITGESGDDKHKGEIDVDSFSWGATNQGTSGHGGGAGSGKVDPHDLTFIKKIDKSSPVLMVGCATGQHYKSAVLTVRKPGTGQQEYLKISMDEVFISSYQVNGAGSGSIVPAEHVTLNFAKLEMSYKEQKADGTLGPEVKQKYDFAANKKI